MNRIIYLLFFLGMVFVTGQSTYAKQAKDIQVVVAVKEAAITNQDIDQRARLELILRGEELTPAAIKATHEKAQQSLIDDQIKLHAAKEKKMTIKDEEINASLEQLAAQNHMNRAQLIAMLKSKGVSQGAISTLLRAQMAWGRYIRAHYEPLVNITDPELDAMEKDMARKKSEHKPDLNDMAVTLHQAFYPLKPDSSEADMAHYGPKIENIITVNSSKVFLQKVKEHKAALKTVTARIKDIPPEMKSLIRGCKIGHCLQPIMTPEGLLVINVAERRMPEYKLPKRDELKGLMEQDQYSRYSTNELMRLKRLIAIEYKKNKNF